VQSFDRRVDGNSLAFDIGRDTDGHTFLQERGGERTWSSLSGRSQSGGAPLTVVLTSRWDAAAWAKQHPDGTVWTR